MEAVAPQTRKETDHKRRIKKVAVVGSGVMGSRIACHFANIGLDVLLLDIVSAEAKASTDKNQRNKIVNDALMSALKSNPAPLYHKSFANKIKTGNLDDDLAKISDADWVIEVVIERLDIKKQVFENIEKYRKPGSLITSNTSGIPIHLMSEGRSEDFKKNFCGTHFFNPPRYLKLLEIIPSPSTDPTVIAFLMDYGKRFLGKTTVLAKDTPAFIANRIGVFAIQDLFHTVKQMDLTVEEVDKLTGPIIGRAKSATFRTCDVVGLDTLALVATGVKNNCPGDERKNLFELPDYLQKMIENKWLGSKTKQGFYFKTKNAEGKSVIQSLDLNTLTYVDPRPVKFATLDILKPIEDLNKRLAMAFAGTDKAGDFYKKTFSSLFQYVSNRIPEISDELFKIDDAMKAGFGYQAGPFETWDAVGVENALKIMEDLGYKPAAWVYAMVESGAKSFYKVEGGYAKYYDIPTKSYQIIPGSEKVLALANIRAAKTIWKNAGTTLVDLGDGILNLEFHTKMNTIGAEVIEGIHKAIDIAEQSYDGLVISNDGENFSAGANVGMILMMAIEGEWDQLNFAIKKFQDTMMRVRYSSIPVVVATHNLTLGGGCELTMHADAVVAHAESYIGLVEFGVGVIPGGGGTKEFALRFSDELHEGDMRINQFRNRFLTIGQARVSTSAYEAFDLGYLRKGIDTVVVSRDHQLATAKKKALELAENGYTQKPMRKDINVLGKEALGIVYVGADSMLHGKYISEHDALISEKLGTVLAGGNLSGITQVSEQYLLDLERKTFLELCQTEKTMKRMESLVKSGKILRN